jgi:hypothetical protein
MKKSTDVTTPESNEAIDMPVLKTATESVLPVKELIPHDHIGLKKAGSDSLVTVHKSMRKYYTEGWEIIEPTAKKK